ncbi:hypothetical protein [Chryseobacterium gambrini]|uniref:hypothetical protein n=1 Tax=Chryseobacterium gambrini TaxID=373672 RepID=UPI003D0EBEC3
MASNKQKRIFADKRFPHHPELRDAFIDGYEQHEDLIEEEKSKSKKWAICTSALILLLTCIMLALPKQTLLINILSVLFIFTILVNAYHVAKWLDNSWCLIGSVGIFGLFLWLGRGEITFSYLHEKWEIIMNKQIGLEKKEPSNNKNGSTDPK